MNSQPIERLTPTDLINLYVETPTAPTHVGALAVLGAGTLHLEDIRAAINLRLSRVPRLRQIIHRTGPLGGRPVWVDDVAFRIERHIQQVSLPSRQSLTDLTMRLVMRPLDRTHPLWRIWLVTGVPDGDVATSVALVFVMHHVVADGFTILQLVRSLMDPTRLCEDTAAEPWRPQRPPSRAELIRDNLRRMASASRRIRLGVAQPWRMLAGLRHAPSASLNHPVGRSRRLEALTLNLAAVKEVAHRHGGKVNDVVLALAAGGIRDLLLARSERVEGVDLHASVAVSLRPAGKQDDIGNRTGGMVVRLPLDPDPHRRLHRIAHESAVAKSQQPPTAGNTLLVWLARIGLLRSFSRHQHMVNIVESNIAGPPDMIGLLDVPITGIVPIGALVGNLSLGFLALSYMGQLTIAVQADADQHPDLPVVVAAMRREAHELLTLPAAVGTPATQ